MVRGRIRVWLGIGLDLVSGGFFRRDFFLQPIEKYVWAIQKSLFPQTNQDSTFWHTCENSKMFKITSKYFSFFNNKPPAS